jgi:hypothetical protein
MSEIEVAYIPLQIDPLPSLTKEEAAKSLISYLYGLGAEYIEIRGIEEEWQIRRESPNGPQHIFIVFTCWVDWPAGSSVYYKNFWEFAVDGHTGEIVWGYPLEFSEGSPSSPPKIGIEKGKEKVNEKVKETPAPIPQKTESSGKSAAILVGSSLFAIGIGYGLLKFLRF